MLNELGSCTTGWLWFGRSRKMTFMCTYVRANKLLWNFKTFLPAVHDFRSGCHCVVCEVMMLSQAYIRKLHHPSKVCASLLKLWCSLTKQLQLCQMLQVGSGAALYGNPAGTWDIAKVECTNPVKMTVSYNLHARRFQNFQEHYYFGLTVTDGLHYMYGATCLAALLPGNL